MRRRSRSTRRRGPAAELGLEPELAGARAGGDDHRVGAVLVVADPDAERPLREVDARDVVGEELRAETLGLAAEVLHHRRAQHAVGITGVVLDVARDHQLAAPAEAFDHQRLEVCARGVERSRVPGRAASDHDHIPNVTHFLLLQTPYGGVVSGRTLETTSEPRRDVPVISGCVDTLDREELRKLLDELGGRERSRLALDR